MPLRALNSDVRILVVDDDADVALGAAHLLERAGYATATALDGVEALEVLRTFRPQLVLSDRDMPRMDGLEMCRRIKSDPAASDVFVILVSGTFTESDEQSDGLDSGADGYIARPIANRELLARVAAFVRIVRLSRSLRERNAELETDITERRRIAEALRTSEARLALALDQARLAPWEMDAATATFIFNDRFYALYGTTAEREGGYRMSAEVYAREFLPAEEQSIVAPAVARLLAGDIQEIQLEHRIRRRDGETRHLLVLVTSVRDANGRIVSTRGVNQDITERKRLEERLRQSSKLEGIGRLAGGMAHEFNTILAAMLLNLNLVKMASQGVEARDLLRDLDELTWKAADLIKQLLAFSRQSVMRVQTLDLAAALMGQHKILGRLLGESVTVGFSTAGNQTWVSADKGMIENVVLNLCLNARDALKEGGHIRLHLEATEIDAARAGAQEGAQPGRYVCLSVTDTGCGMDERIMKRLFEPFFTTKPVGQGVGLGLATVRGIVQQHHGWVEVESHVGKGSTFRVYLPAVTQPVVLTSAPTPNRLVHGKGTILVVEDEPTLRKATRTLFVRMGYVVLEAATCKEALEVWDAHRAQIDLIYSDMEAPGALTGLQIAQKALVDKPAVKAIITSGYHGDDLDRTRLASSSIVFLPKPCDAAILTSVIHECLSRA